jgi:hypothetical protein
MLFLIYLFNKKIEELPSLSDRPNVDNVIRDPENEDVGGWGDDWDTNYDPNETPEKPTQSSVLAGLLYRTNNKLLSNPTYLNESTYNYDREEIKTDYLNFSSAPQELTPKLGWFKVENIDGVRKITEFQFYYEDRQVSRYWLNKSFEYISDEDENSSKVYDVNREVVLETKEIKYNGINKIVNVADYGAIPDDNIDDTASIKKAVEEINKEYDINFSHVAILYFPTGHYNVSVTKDAAWYSEIYKNEGTVIFLKNTINPIIVEFANSKLSLAGNAICNYRMLCGGNVNHLTIQNGILQGDRMTHNYINYSVEEGKSSSSYSAAVSHEQGHGLAIFASTYAYIKNMEVYDFTGDSLGILNRYNHETFNTNVFVENCYFHHSRRQGISVLDSEYVLVRNTEISHIGTYDWAYTGDYDYVVSQGINIDKTKIVNGTAPMSGIDIEPDTSTLICQRFEMKNSYIHDTTEMGMITGLQKDKEFNTRYFLVENSVVAETVVLNFILKKNNSVETDDWRNGYENRAMMRNCVITMEKGYKHLELDGLELVNCNMIKNRVGVVTANLEDDILDNCNIIIPRKMINAISGAGNGQITIVESIVRNCTFENWLGYYKNNTGSEVTNGILITGNLGGKDQLSIDESWYNNTFINCVTKYKYWAIMNNFKFIGENLLTDDLQDGKLYSIFRADPFWNGYSGSYEVGDSNIASKFVGCTFNKTVFRFHQNGANPKMIFRSCIFDEYCGPNTNYFYPQNTYVLE